MNYSPTKLILIFFFIAISFGALLLSLPFCRNLDYSYSLLTNLFTSASAVCVTGLSVVDIGQYYTLWGQLLILFLIQIGGLGYMTLSTIIAVILGRMTLKDRQIIKEIIDITSFSGLLHLLKKIIAMVFIIESAGAVILTGIFLQKYDFLKALYLGIFHSVSAFCNAGLSIFPNNLEGFSENYLLLMVIGSLIILGGIGFLVLVDFYGKLKSEKYKFSLHSNIVLTATAVLLAGGFAVYFVAEAGNVLKGKDLVYSIFNSLFHSITCRTAGFSSIAEGLTTQTTAVFTDILMFIGASPGGTGGGIKTTTFVIVLLFVITVARGGNEVNIGVRRMPSEIVHKAVAIFMLSLIFVAVSASLLFLFEKIGVLDLVFEVISAFGTVGLSRGITAALTDQSRIVLILTMFIGRVGVLTLLIALFDIKERSSISYPEERIMIS